MLQMLVSLESFASKTDIEYTHAMTVEMCVSMFKKKRWKMWYSFSVESEIVKNAFCSKCYNKAPPPPPPHVLNQTILQQIIGFVVMPIQQQGKSEGFDSCDRPSNLKLDSNRQFFCPCDCEIWWMTLQNNRAPLLSYFKLCASFCTHWWIQT